MAQHGAGVPDLEGVAPWAPGPRGPGGDRGGTRAYPIAALPRDLGSPAPPAPAETGEGRPRPGAVVRDDDPAVRARSVQEADLRRGGPPRRDWDVFEAP